MNVGRCGYGAREHHGMTGTGSGSGSSEVLCTERTTGKAECELVDGKREALLYDVLVEADDIQGALSEKLVGDDDERRHLLRDQLVA
jgi:hypothetical protein